MLWRGRRTQPLLNEDKGWFVAFLVREKIITARWAHSSDRGHLNKHVLNLENACKPVLGCIPQADPEATCPARNPL
jgi:hypothetical protein